MVYTKYRYGRDKEQAEKAVLPTIVFINTNHPSFNEENNDLRRKGFTLSFGWWDWSFTVGFILK